MLSPNISSLLNPLEYQLKESFIPAIIGKQYVPDDIRKIISLPAKMGGLGINNIALTSDLEYDNSVAATRALADAIYN